MSVSKEKTIGFTIIGIAVVFLVVLIFMSGQRNNNQDNEQSTGNNVPSNWVLGTRINEVVTSKTDPKDVDTVQYTTEKSLEELINFYKNEFSKNGWGIVFENNNVEFNIYALSAENSKTGLDARILIRRQSNNTYVVLLTYGKVKPIQ